MRCASCQHEVTAAAKFCEECGAPLARLAPESYTPKHLAEKILTSKSALEGERKQVTVLCCRTSRAKRNVLSAPAFSVDRQRRSESAMRAGSAG